MKVEPGYKYSRDHEWIRVEGKEGVIGITDYAQDQLSDVVYVELPEVGDSFAQDDILATVESVKAASDVYMPVGGEVLAINEALEDAPEQVNQDPFGKAWFVRIAISDPAEIDGLMDAEAYKAYIDSLEE